MADFEFAAGLAKIKDQKTFYVKFEPEILDISDKNFNFNIEIYCQGYKLVKSVSISNFKEVHSYLKQILFLKDKKIISFNFKNYCSFFKKTTGKTFSSDCKIFDLKVLGNLLALAIKEPPKTFIEAINAFKKIHADYYKVSNIYEQIHIPLITKVIPSIETIGLVNKKEKKIQYCYYEIEGQENGRLSSSCRYKDCFLPFNLKKENKEELKLKNDDDVFLSFDYKNMEVSVLEFLSKDSNLRAVLQEGKDFYESLYKNIYNKDCSPEKRKKVKKIFLPYVYGASPKALAESCNVSLAQIEEFIKNTRKIFPHTFDWLDSYSNNSNDNLYSNMFGKRRIINEKYKARNFIVQSTASIFCLDKLVDLSNYLNHSNIVFYVHDSYVVSCNRKDLNSNIEVVKNILLNGGNLFENILTNVSCEIGENLNSLLNYEVN